MLYIAVNNIEKKTTKRVPLYKDKNFISALSARIIQENNERLRKIKQNDNNAK